MGCYGRGVGWMDMRCRDGVAASIALYACKSRNSSRCKAMYDDSCDLLMKFRGGKTGINVDLAVNTHAGHQVRKPTNVVSTICDDRGEEPTYGGVTMSELIEEEYGVGDVLSLLWFKRKLPKYATKFMEM